MSMTSSAPFATFVAAFVSLSAPALAFEVEEIGMLKATFDGQSIEQPTVIARTEDQADATAFLIVPGGGFSSLSLTGFSLENQRLDLGAVYMSETPGPQTAPMDVTITYAPTGTKEHWTSEDAPTPAAISFTTLEVTGDQGRATGTFTGVLCYATDYESGADTDNCRPIEGSFDTAFFVE